MAAAAGAAKASNPDMTVNEFKELLIDTLDDAGNEGYDTTFGYGILNLEAIADALTTTDPTEPTESTSPAETEESTEPAEPSDTGESSQRTSLERFVTRLYTNLLHRVPDEKGLASWVNALENAKATGAKVVAGFVLSDEFSNKPIDKNAYVTALYRTIFDREPDEAGLKAWLSVMNRGYSNKKALAGFLI